MIADHDPGAKMSPDQPSISVNASNRTNVLAALVLVAGLAGLAIVFFTMRVCDQQVTATGSVVRVCRHPQMTDPPVVALGAVVVAALGVFFGEISGFGFTLKRKVDAASATAQAANLSANQAKEAIQEAAGDLAEGIGVALRGRVPIGTSHFLTEMEDPVARLAARYNEIRWTMPSGRERTAELTEVMLELQDLLRNAADFDVGSHLHSADRGLRLAGLAFLYANPAPSWANEVADVALSEDRSFGQYWALVTLRRLVRGGDCSALDDARRTRLRDRLTTLSADDDRAIEVTKLLRVCPPPR